MKVHVVYFAQVAEKIGLSKEEIELPDGSNSTDLLTVLYNKYPMLRDLTFKVAVDHELSNRQLALKPDCEVALLPPFAGG
ncbi:MAG: MoaD/ThiS family protein [Crocinitomicaceae bacterium]|nr:MoaD/ThiS family protein [Crocinitomicaceae bacterium]